MRSSRPILAAVALGAFASTLAATAQESGPRPAMHRIFESLAALLPASFDEQRFVDPSQRPWIESELRRLSESSDALRTHADERDATFQYLSGSLASDVDEIRRRYDQGRYEEARYYLQELTQNCIACHTRLPSSREFPLASRLTARIEVEKLAPRERAQLRVATRRFGEALTIWEAMFADPSADPTEFDIRGDLIDYLTVCIRVERDPERARRTFTALAKRPDVPRYLQRHFATWVRALADVGAVIAEEPSLARARTLVEAANHASAFPGGREMIVHDLVASSVLHRTIDAAAPGDPGLAEAFYLLGIIEARTADSYWIPQTEFHFEAAIRADPKGPFAEPAYAMLEEYIVLGNGGLSDALLPPDARRKLDELATLIGP